MKMLNVSSKFAICGVPIRVDSYRFCEFGCKYCFSNNREIMKFKKEIQKGDIKQLERYLEKIFIKKQINKNNFLDVLVSEGYTWHCGGMSDPFQPCEKEYQITKKLIELSNKYKIKILFSTKSDTVYDCKINKELHSFQLSISNVYNNKELEPNVPNIESRYKFFKELKSKGFKVGIRIQPFIPNISTLKIVEMFKEADHFILEGIKIVPQNKEQKELLLKMCKLEKENFVQMGLLNLKPIIRLDMYKPFIEYFEKNNISYSIADNDLRFLGNNYCCCGDYISGKTTTFNSTYMIKTYGEDYAKEQLDYELFESGVRDCKCNYLFTSNRQENCISVQDFYDKRFYRKTSPFSPKYQYKDLNTQTTIFDYLED